MTKKPNDENLCFSVLVDCHFIIVRTPSIFQVLIRDLEYFPASVHSVECNVQVYVLLESSSSVNKWSLFMQWATHKFI